MQNILKILFQGNTLNKKQSAQLMRNILDKKLSSIQIASALISMKIRGETFEEIAGSADILLTLAHHFPSPSGLFADITGTGGDCSNTINISTASALIASTCNVKIIKHGNYSISGLTGSMDLLAQNDSLNIKEYTNQALKNFNKLGICFLYAPHYHEIFRYVMPIRQQLKTPTLFNIVGPLINPSHPPLALIGVYKKELLSPIIQTLKLLKYHHAMVVHCGGIDEVGLHAPTHVIELRNNMINNYTLTTSDFGLHYYPVTDLYCYSKKQAYEYMINLLKGKGKSAHECIVAANVALLLKLFGHDNLRANVYLALDKISHGVAYNRLQSLLKSNNIRV